MSTLRVNTIQDSTGSSSPAINGLAKAWVNFNGTGTVAIRAALNVSSITDNGTGKYTVNYTNALADVNAGIVANADVDDSVTSSRTYNIEIYGRATTSVSIASYSNSDFEDHAYISVAVFR